MKSNDSIPEDEMLLAEALAEAVGRGLQWSSWVAIQRDDDGEPVACCAVGALVLAGKATLEHGKQYPADTSLWGVSSGNDFGGRWMIGPDDRGESLGWAFRCAMTQEDS